MDKPCRRLRGASVLLVIPLILLAAACASSQAETPAEPQPALATQESALNADEEASNDIDVPLVALACPDDVAYFKLQLNHTFNFSPGRETEKMLVEGRTLPNAWCFVTLNGKEIEPEECLVDYEYNGFIQGSDGKCAIQGASTALITIEGNCGNAGDDETPQVYLEITEIQNPDADLSGALNCPGFSSAYIGFYPPSSSIVSFPIQERGASASDSSDMTGQFEMHKTWTLIPANFP